MNRIQVCRSCKSSDLHEVLSLGNLAFTGVFPSSADEKVPYGQLEVVYCQKCQLGQLAHSFPADQLYGSNYGYRSGLNSSMVQHLFQISNNLESGLNLSDSDAVLDIGSNDGTLLNSYRNKKIKRVGIDPTISKFNEYYERDITQIADFFTRDKVSQACSFKFKIITSIAMFYDLENPVDFAFDIAQLLEVDGYWYFEQSYAPWMIRTGAFDTICHEHLEYYSLASIKAILDSVGLTILEANINDVNGGSIAILATKNPNRTPDWSVDWLLKEEEQSGVNSLESWRSLSKTIEKRKQSLESLLEFSARSGRPLYGLGASTKGNVLLQSLHLSSKEIVAIGEVNSYKWGRFTPGSLIPIISENEVLDIPEKDLLVLPWHFKSTFLSKLSNGSRRNRLIFPLPEVEVLNI